MNKPDERRTWFETVSEKLKFVPCRQVLMSPYLEAAGFTEIRNSLFCVTFKLQNPVIIKL